MSTMTTFKCPSCETSVQTFDTAEVTHICPKLKMRTPAVRFLAVPWPTEPHDTVCMFGMDVWFDEAGYWYSQAPGKESNPINVFNLRTEVFAR